MILIIYSQPPQNTEEHRFWEDMKDVPSFEIIPSEEAEKVAKVVEDTGASRFLQKLSVHIENL